MRQVKESLSNAAKRPVRLGKHIHTIYNLQFTEIRWVAAALVIL
jgi:hypothetical protein